MAVDTLRPRRGAVTQFFDRLPYWLLAAILIGVLLVWTILADADYRVIFTAVARGVPMTVYVTVIAYLGSVLTGLLVGLARLSRVRLLRETSTFYVEIVRGVPMLVLLYYIAFVGAPGLVDLINWVGAQLSAAGLTAIGEPWVNFSVRDLDFATRAILALVIGYSAFISEIFRAGIQSIERGQSEAAISLGMTRWQTLRHIILPQAVRRVLPPLGKELIAMLKDSALVSVFGVQDITQMGKVYAASTFRFFETYNVVAFLYLVMTIGLTLIVRFLEQRMSTGQH